MTRTFIAMLALAPTVTSGLAQNAPQSLLDGCTLSALDRVPKVVGTQVKNTSIQYTSTYQTGYGDFQFYHVSIEIEFNGRPVSYGFLCRIFDNREAQIIRSQAAPSPRENVQVLPPAPSQPAEDAIKVTPRSGKQIAPGVTMTPMPPGPPVYQRR